MGLWVKSVKWNCRREHANDLTIISMLLVNPQFRGNLRPANVATKLSERDHETCNKKIRA